MRKAPYPQPAKTRVWSHIRESATPGEEIQGGPVNKVIIPASRSKIKERFT